MEPQRIKKNLTFEYEPVHVFGISDEFKKRKIDYVLGDWDELKNSTSRTIRIGI
jgi:hypothetical protein